MCAAEAVVAEQKAKDKGGQGKGGKGGKGGGGGKGGNQGLTPRSKDFSLWYQEVIAAADLVRPVHLGRRSSTRTRYDFVLFILGGAPE